MARRKKKVEEEPSKHRFYATCNRCKRTFESDDISDVPECCDRCGGGLTINDRKLLLSRRKPDLLKVLYGGEK